MPVDFSLVDTHKTLFSMIRDEFSLREGGVDVWIAPWNWNAAAQSGGGGCDAGELRWEKQLGGQGQSIQANARA
jgi:hypothetical protein